MKKKPWQLWSQVKQGYVGEFDTFDQARKALWHWKGELTGSGYIFPLSEVEDGTATAVITDFDSVHLLSRLRMYRGYSDTVALKTLSLAQVRAKIGKVRMRDFGRRFRCRINDYSGRAVLSVEPQPSGSIIVREALVRSGPTCVVRTHIVTPEDDILLPDNFECERSYEFWRGINTVGMWLS